MRKSRRTRHGAALRSAVALVGIILAVSAQGRSAFASGGTPINVTTDADSGAGSLRQAILDANSNPDPDTITFDSGIGAIKPAALGPLPAIVAPVTIDGSTLVGTQLVGTDAGPGANGLQVDVGGSGSVIRGLQISGFTGSGIYLNGAHDTVIGGVAPFPGNVITGNGNDGVTIVGDATAINNRVLGNRIYGNDGGGIDLGDSIQPGGGGTVGCPAGGVAPGPNSYQCEPTIAVGPPTTDADPPLGPYTPVTVTAVARAGVASARVELFKATTCPFGIPGEIGVGARAEELIESVEVPLVTASGYATGSVTIKLVPPLTGGALTATTTTPDGTSKFASCARIHTPTDERITVASAPTSVSAGQPMTLDFTVTNGGPSRDAQPVAFVDLSTTPSTLTSVTSSGGTCTPQPGPLAICTLSGLDPGASATITLIVVPTTSDPWSATAQVEDIFSDDPVPANNEVTVAIGGATPASGSPVVVSLAPATAGTQPASVTFATVTTGGTTSLTTSTTPPIPLPGLYQLAGQAIYYDLSTTADHTGSIRVCFSYAGIVPPPTALLHYDTTIPSPDWFPIQDLAPAPADVAANRICGSTASLSPFALATIAPPPVLILPSNMDATATSSDGATVPYVATAKDHLGTSVTPTCSPASGSTFPVGATQVTCAATDTFGQSASGSFTVTVGYRFAGFTQPLNDPITATNPQSVFKGGSTIPVKFALTFANGSAISDMAAAAIASACGAKISLMKTPGNAPPVDEVINSTTANTGSCFRYDSGAHQFIFNLGTKPYPAPSLYLVGATVRGPSNELLVTHSLAIGLR